MASDLGSVALTLKTSGVSKERDDSLSKANLALLASNSVFPFNICPITFVLLAISFMTIIRSLTFSSLTPLWAKAIDDMVTKIKMSDLGTFKI